MARFRPMGARALLLGALGALGVLHSGAGAHTVELREALGAEALHPMDGPDVDVRIHIDLDAVRFRIAMNLAFVDEVVDVGRELEDSVHPLEQPALHAALLEHYRATNAVTVDGVAVTQVPVPESDGGFEYTPADPALVPLFPRSGARALAKVTLALEYPLKSAPERIDFHWGTYPPNETLAFGGEPPLLEINAQLRANGVDELIVFKESAPDVVWQGSLSSPEERFLPVPGVVGPRRMNLPLATLACALAAVCLFVGAGFGAPARRRVRLRLGFVALVLGAALEPFGHARVANPFASDRGLPDAESAQAIFRPLHANIYRAFDYEEESDVYDALARSVDGPLLARLYKEVYTSLVQEEAGGAVSRVRQVELLDADVRDVRRDADGRARFRVEAHWRIEGVVFHWGHAHVRTNEYRADYGVVETPAGWRIDDSETLEERRVDAMPLLDPGAFAAEDGAKPAFPAVPEAGTDY